MNKLKNVFCDTHCHLDAEKFMHDQTEVIQRAREHGVELMVTIGTNVESAANAVALSLQSPSIFAVIGIDPHTAHSFSEENWRIITELAHHPRVVGIGETGLDFHYYYSTEKEQIFSFQQHIQLACAFGLPLVIHNRNADKSVLRVLDEYIPDHNHTVIFHSFASSNAFARECIKRGFIISLSGMLTFKSMNWLSDVLKMTPLTQLLFETDAPYLAPVPYRGNRNEPMYVVRTYEWAAQLLRIDLEILKAQIFSNVLRLFPKVTLH